MVKTELYVRAQNGDRLAGAVGDSLPASGDAVAGRVKWYDTTKGYGFVVADDGQGDILIHANVLRAFGASTVAEGAAVMLEVQRTEKGRQAVRIASLDAPNQLLHDPREMRPTDFVADAVFDSPLEPARVKWFDKVKGFGFVNVFGRSEDIFVHMEVLRRSAIPDLAPGEAVAVRIIAGPRGRMAAEVCLWERGIPSAAPNGQDQV
jgi:CspA family cold shock protein